MHFLVAGGAGFLGRHLISNLLESNHSVICIDNLKTGDTQNIAFFAGDERFSFFEKDVKDKFELKVDGIFNLACPASPDHYQKDPIDTLLTSVLGAANLLELAELNNCRIFQASTSEIYGDPAYETQSEEYWGNVNPIGIRSCYDEGKRAAESLFFDFKRTKNIDIRIARIFNTYGPYMRLNDGRVVSNFIINALQGDQLVVYGDGLQTRSFCYVDDTVRGILKLFFNEETHGPINIGNPSQITMLDLANEIITLTQSSSTIKHVDKPNDDPLKRKPDISKAKNLLGWEPRVTRSEGLYRTIQYFKRVIESEK